MRVRKDYFVRTYAPLKLARGLKGGRIEGMRIKDELTLASSEVILPGNRRSGSPSRC